MKKLRIEKNMPHTPPPDGFFEEFTNATLLKIEHRKRHALILRGIVVSTLSVAATIALVLWVGIDNESVHIGEDCIAEQFSLGVSTYASELSDYEIKALLADTESEDMFYSNL